MIAFAYHIEVPSIHLLGLPNWAMNTGYDVAAKPAEGFPALDQAENYEQVRIMMRAMLADRFQLQLHRETRQERVASLEVAQGGIKIKEVDPPVPPEKEGFVNAAMGDDGGRIIGRKSTMAGFATMLSLFLKRQVIDRTGSKAYYDFDVKWSVPATDGPRSEFGAEGISALISNLRAQFGLRLTNAEGAVEYWVVDSLKPPASN
jgi:uncharacterized protein (TIGR03435 family)